MQHYNVDMTPAYFSYDLQNTILSFLLHS